ncbi:hypothetical protein PVA45_01670 [Entomospira entomophila]|uniref:Uncharacterized protein n=1 Tax=Entomospira entomophila TaxID=2719988 RepID=A0A968G917_9SPIO|nr:hypothetical protein [Entomospira entomophilus]NIZ40221.1 hypothetical protein [Entomospira entomophilus]WDI35780.1 hypothetical protein PVA45_01670 [Entomospira entomophilus]
MKKLPISILLLLLVLGSWLSAFSGSRWYTTEIVIYQQADPLTYGYASQTSALILRNIHEFTETTAANVTISEHEEGFLTATLIDASTAEALDKLFQEVQTSPASSSALKIDGFYSSIQFDNIHLHRITQYHHYNEFHHQITTLLPQVHYLYNDFETDIMIEFSLEPAPMDMLLHIHSTLGDDQDISTILQQYQQNYVLRIHRTNTLQDTASPTIEDVMLAATFLGSPEQPWMGIPAGNNQLYTIIQLLEEHPAMSIYRNVQ